MRSGVKRSRPTCSWRRDSSPRARIPARCSDWLRDRLAAFKVPRYLEFVESFPLTPSERIAKHLLKPGRTWDATIPGWKESHV